MELPSKDSKMGNVIFGKKNGPTKNYPLFREKAESCMFLLLGFTLLHKAPVVVLTCNQKCVTDLTLQKEVILDYHGLYWIILELNTAKLAE